MKCKKQFTFVNRRVRAPRHHMNERCASKVVTKQTHLSVSLFCAISTTAVTAVGCFAVLVRASGSHCSKTASRNLCAYAIDVIRYSRARVPPLRVLRVSQPRHATPRHATPCDVTLGLVFCSYFTLFNGLHSICAVPRISYWKPRHSQIDQAYHSSDAVAFKLCVRGFSRSTYLELHHELTVFQPAAPASAVALAAFRRPCLVSSRCMYSQLALPAAVV